MVYARTRMIRNRPRGSSVRASRCAGHSPQRPAHDAQLSAVARPRVPGSLTHHGRQRRVATHRRGCGLRTRPVRPLARRVLLRRCKPRSAQPGVTVVRHATSLRASSLASSEHGGELGGRLGFPGAAKLEKEEARRLPQRRASRFQRRVTAGLRHRR
jgi:hypothetical protein